MRLTLVKRAQMVVNQMKPAHNWHQKYNYKVREHTLLDGMHGYAWYAIKTKRELAPLVACFVAYAGIFTATVWWAFSKTEIQFNRFTEHHPWDWERAQHVFEKRHRLIYDDSFLWKRIPELDKLQNEMLEAKNAKIAAEKAAQKSAHHH